MKLKNLRTYVILFFSVVYFQSAAQSFTKLDDRLSFNDFKLGSSVEAFENDLTLYLTISYGTKYYKYNGKAVKDLYNLKIHEVNLGFHADQFVYLDLYFKKLSEEEFFHLLKSLENEYGTGEEFKALDDGVISVVKWNGDNLVMQLCRYGKAANDEDDRNMTVLSFEQQSY